MPTTKNTAHKTTQQIEEAVAKIAAQARIPSATYRLQFHPGFTFRDGRALVDYLHALGISDLYASPIFLPRTGSTHGYDVTDPTQLNWELGSDEDFEALSRKLQEQEMGFVLDIVPNHMGINDPRNRWWMDVLENGPSSEYASFFDIQWHPIKQELENKVLLPILGGQYGEVLERGELKLNYANGSFHFSYYETTLPLSPRTYMLVLRLVLERLQQVVEAAASTTQSTIEPYSTTLTSTAPAIATPSSALLELESILTALSYLPPRTETDPERLTERAREKEIIKRRLALLVEENEEVRSALDEVVTTLNGEEGNRQSFDLLDQLVEAQAYRAAFWRVAGEEINYRRFFDINDLAAIRVEDAKVFDATHALALRLIAEGKATGLRIDHPDGLNDPPAYFRRLQERYLDAKLQERGIHEQPSQEEQNAEEDLVKPVVAKWLKEQARHKESVVWPLYVVVEKILSESEPLPFDWSVFGTTGYDFLASANGIFVDTRNERAFTKLYSRFKGDNESLAELTISTKMMIMRESLVGEINALSYELDHISERNRQYRDFTLGGLRTALREVIACLGIYRTYIDAYEGTVSERDRKFVQAAVRTAKRRHPLLDDSLFDYIQDTVLLRNMNQFSEEDRPMVAQWVMKFQQITGPVMAKGVEDTAFYRYNRLVSLNEVGDHPGQFGISINQFHDDNKRRVKHWPHSMLATSTHDNKRSEDVRARINILSEMPDLWQASLRQWSRLNATKKRTLEGVDAPDANDEYLFYQTLLGAWPLAPDSAKDNAAQADSPWGFLLQPGDTPEYNEFRQRIVNYMLKAVKEAKLYTSWANPYEEYEEALQRFVERVLQPSPRNRFLRDLAPVARMVAYYGQFNSLAQTLLKLTAPGVPDIYQGNELWDFSLVDPDNRRPVDYSRRQTLFKELAAAEKRKRPGQLAFVKALLEESDEGRIKLYITSRTLHFRRDHYDLFRHGSYLPVEAGGERALHLCAYMREVKGQSEGQIEGQTASQQALVVVPRLVATLTNRTEQPPIGAELWGDTWLVLPEGTEARTYRNLYTGEQISVEERKGQKVLLAANLLANFPLALLTPEG